MPTIKNNELSRHPREWELARSHSVTHGACQGPHVPNTCLSCSSWQQHSHSYPPRVRQACPLVLNHTFRANWLNFAALLAQFARFAVLSHTPPNCSYLLYSLLPHHRSSLTSSTQCLTVPEYTAAHILARVCWVVRVWVMFIFSSSKIRGGHHLWILHLIIYMYSSLPSCADHLTRLSYEQRTGADSTRWSGLYEHLAVKRHTGIQDVWCFLATFPGSVYNISLCGPKPKEWVSLCGSEGRKNFHLISAGQIWPLMRKYV